MRDTFAIQSGTKQMRMDRLLTRLGLHKILLLGIQVQKHIRYYCRSNVHSAKTTFFVDTCIERA